MPPNGMMGPPPGGMPPFPPNAGSNMPPNGFPPFPPNGQADNKTAPASGGPPPTFVPASNSNQGGSGPNIHPDRMRMLNGM
ncbi:hypothetical protein CPB86DRAFT_827296 [Serendipita vermifera]|nr:hypothetical protein CPB86DRAFT_827296 [Serendipita vermifera]